MARRDAQAPMTLAERVRADLDMTGGRMPITVIVRDEIEREEGLRLVRRHPHRAALTFRTLTEDALLHPRGGSSR